MAGNTLEETKNLIERALDQQLVNGLFPLNDPIHLIDAFENGKMGTMVFGEREIDNRKLTLEYRRHMDYPYDNKRDFISDFIRAAEKEGDLEDDDGSEREETNWNHSLSINRR